MISKEQRSINFSSQNKEVQVNLSLLGGDLDFLKIIAFHPLAMNILSKFEIEGQELPLVS